MPSRESLVGVLLFLAAASLQAETAHPVSPGSAEGVALISTNCPTFHWTAVDPTLSVDLVVYLAEQSRSADADGKLAPKISLTLPAGAQGWTPSLDHCLEPGSTYAWSVRTGGGSGHSEGSERSEWSEPYLFEISQAPAIDEVRKALRVLERYADLKRNDPETTGPSRLRAAANPGTRYTEPLESTTVGSLVGFQVAVENSTAVSVRNSLGTTVLSRAELASGADAVEGRSYSGGIAARFEHVGLDDEAGTALFVNSAICCDGNQQFEHTAVFQATGGVGADILALRSSETLPGTGTNFITFFDPSVGGLLGQIQGDGAGGVEFDGSLAGPQSDFAEFLPKRDPSDSLLPGDVVGLSSGTVSLRTENAVKAMVVSTRPLVTGGRPEPGREDDYARIAFLGQVPVRVRGSVTAGDLLVPSGLEDGTAVAVPEDRLTVDQRALIIGSALEGVIDGGDTTTVRALVGFSGSSFASAGISTGAGIELQLYRGLLGLLFGAALWRVGTEVFNSSRRRRRRARGTAL